MIISARCLGVLAMLALPFAGSAQNLLHFKFRGVCYETNGNSTVTTRVVTEKTLLKEIARDAGNLDSSGWVLAYHIGGNALGDTVEVIRASTGEVLDNYIGLYFGEDASLGRIALKTEKEQKRIDYIYTKQNSHSMGAAFVSKREIKPGRPYITGRMHWIMAPDGKNGIRVYTGTFRAGLPYVFGGQAAK